MIVTRNIYFTVFVCAFWIGEVAGTTARKDMKNTVARSGEMVQLHCTLPTRKASVTFREFAQSPTGTVVGSANWEAASVTHPSRFGRPPYRDILPRSLLFHSSLTSSAFKTISAYSRASLVIRLFRRMHDSTSIINTLITPIHYLFATHICCIVLYCMIL